MKLGIDFGTTNSAIAYFDGSQLEIVKADANNANPHILPSLIYFHRDGELAVGTQAAERYLENESNRSIRWKPKPMGQVLITVAGAGKSPIQYWQPLNILVDEAATGRLFQSVKTYLRNLLVDGTQVFDRYLTVDQILATLLANLKQQAEAYFNQPCEDVVIGRPVNFSHDPLIDEKAEEILYKAAHLAGFRQISFALEPIGALFLYHTQETQRVNVLTFDFGGGTLDLTVAEVGGQQPPEVLATRGVLLGGDDLDRKIMRMLLKHFAADERSNEFIDPEGLICNVAVSSGSGCETHIMQAGENAYVDLESVWIDKLSIQLSALPAIRTAHADIYHDEEDFLTFTLSYPANVYVAYSENQTGVPAWLTAFSRTPYFVELKDHMDRLTRLPVYVREFEAGNVILGGNEAASFDGVYHHYLVIVERCI